MKGAREPADLDLKLRPRLYNRLARVVDREGLDIDDFVKVALLRTIEKAETKASIEDFDP